MSGGAGSWAKVTVADLKPGDRVRHTLEVEVRRNG